MRQIVDEILLDDKKRLIESNLDASHMRDCIDPSIKLYSDDEYVNDEQVNDQSFYPSYE